MPKEGARVLHMAAPTPGQYLGSNLHVDPEFMKGFAKFLCILDHRASKTPSGGWRPGKLVPGAPLWHATPLVHFSSVVHRKFRNSKFKSVFWGSSIFRQPSLSKAGSGSRPTVVRLRSCRHEELSWNPLRNSRPQKPFS